LSEILEQCVSIVSYIVMLHIAFRILYFIYKRLRPRKDLTNRYGLNTWALVTGGTDGIGKACCFELASMEFNVLIASRNKEKLQRTCDEIKERHLVLTDYIVIDFDRTETTYENYCSVFGEAFRSREISVLVNNVGTFYPKKVVDLSEEECFSNINLNCYPQVHLSHIYLQNRTEKGAIINISSLSAESPMYYFNLYGPTKKFNDFFSKGLSLEYPDLDVLSVRPSAVDTNLSQMKESFLVSTSPQNCAKGIFDDLGYEFDTHGYWVHSVHSYFINLFPERFVIFIQEKIFANLIKNREAKVLREMEKSSS